MIYSGLKFKLSKAFKNTAKQSFHGPSLLRNKPHHFGPLYVSFCSHFNGLTVPRDSALQLNYKIYSINFPYKFHNNH